MKFHVSKRHIEFGMIGSYTRNPITRAIEEGIRAQYSLTLVVEIFNLDFIFIDGAIVDAPEQVQVFLSRFHRGQKVSPISFELPPFPNDFFTRKADRK